MQINLDSFIEIGKQHKLCEDYATHGISGVDGFPYIIVSDGCSSSDNTDVGSRLIAHASRNALLEMRQQNLLDSNDRAKYLKELTLFNLKLSLKALSLPYSTADATLLVAYAFKDRVYFFMYGDGHVLVRLADGGYWSFSTKYAENAPSYLSYELDFNRMGNYSTQYGESKLSYTIDNNGEIHDQLETVNNVLFNNNNCYHDTYPLEYIKSISLMSDGVESYMYNNNASVTDEQRKKITEYQQWIQQFTDYKNTNGEFVTRRLRRIAMNCTTNNIEHFDDVSCATMWVNHE